MNAFEAFNAGSLEDALEIAKGEVKKNPSDVAKRHALCELLCWAGELERADKQLETTMMQDPQSAMTLSLFRQLIRAETSRQECFTQSRAPELLDGVNDQLKKHIELLLCLREGSDEDALELAAAIEASRPTVSGTCDGEAFDDLRDLDDTCSSFFEVLTTTGKYYWIPVDRIEAIAFHPIERPRDLLWRRASMSVQSGPDGDVYIPVNYAGSLGSEDKQLKLGLATVWEGGDDKPVVGQGRRLMLVGEQDKSILEMEEIVFDKSDAAAEPAESAASDESGDGNG